MLDKYLVAYKRLSLIIFTPNTLPCSWSVIICVSMRTMDYFQDQTYSVDLYTCSYVILISLITFNKVQFVISTKSSPK